MRAALSRKSLAVPRRESQAMGPSLEALMSAVASTDPDAVVESIHLYFKEVSLNLEYVYDTNTWVSSLTQSGIAKVAIRIRTNASIDGDSISGPFRVSGSRSAPVINPGPLRRTLTRALSIGQSLLGGTAETVIPTSTRWVFADYDGDAACPRWELHGPDEALDDTKLVEDNYELGESIEGPFPLAYLVGYLRQSQYKIFTRHPDGPRMMPKVTGAYEARDYCIGMFLYLHHMSAIGKTVAGDKHFSFKVTMERHVTLLKAERETILEKDEGFDLSQLKIRRVY